MITKDLELPGEESASGPTLVVGKGRLGTALSAVLVAIGARVEVLGGREAASASSGPVLPYPLVLIAVADHAIEGVAGALRGRLTSGTVALHHSGAWDSSLLAGLREDGVETGSCHPLQSIRQESRGSSLFHGVTFGVEGTPEARRAAAGLALRLGGRPVEIDPRKKALYHLAACLASGGLVGLLAAARDTLVATGFSKSEAVEALTPLALTSLSGALESSPEHALTGPVARGDRATIERHLQALSRWDPERISLYEAILQEQRRLTGC